MRLFLDFAFVFFMGSILGWVIELFFRRLAHGKWVNPGFLVGPCLPIYGFGLCTLSFCYVHFEALNLSPLIIILLIGLFMTLIELIGGEFFLHSGSVKLWDYSNMWGNYKGIICPLFSLIWTLAGAIYYYLLAPYVIEASMWLANHLEFSFVVGMCFGIFIIDFIYSTKVLLKIRKYAEEHNIVVKYEELKRNIHDEQLKMKKKYSFLFAFKPSGSLLDNLDKYFKDYKKSKKR